MKQKRRLRVLIGGERFGVIRNAFLLAGHYAISCDLVESKAIGPHYVGPWEDIENRGYDLAIFHRTCTYLANSGVKHLYTDGRKRNGIDSDRWMKMGNDAWAFWNHMQTCPIPHVAWENPIMHGYAQQMIGPPTQIVQPWWFGTDSDGPDNVTKATGWWLKDLPPLRKTGTLSGLTARAEVHAMGPTKDPEDRRMARSKSPPGMAEAIADQWGRAVSGTIDSAVRNRVNQIKPEGN